MDNFFQYHGLGFFIFKWIHFLAGITWIGVLYYFNFIQGEWFKEIEDRPHVATLCHKLGRVAAPGQLIELPHDVSREKILVELIRVVLFREEFKYFVGCEVKRNDFFFDGNRWLVEVDDASFLLGLLDVLFGRFLLMLNVLSSTTGRNRLDQPCGA